MQMFSIQTQVLSWKDQLTRRRQETGESLRACKLMGNMINWEKKGVLFVLLMIFCFHYVALKQACLAS